ncbi:hypothetical protein [Oceanomicrobium pacificus]|uniref:Cell division and transport-associated protein TolA n=1 Tax=Oceanomicrobium pacificus TaxID=2692916 RepID=A0A6B0TU63_9RHOB|nr:hypothetical protein [Oceanomicrobium pacificus]MXU65315.1 hypothetical protein [Oceanomicrobium pacificus]
MKTGATISGTAHLLLVLLALLWGPLFEHDGEERVTVSNVSIISASEFDAAVSAAPEAPRTDLAAPVAPAISEPDALTPAIPRPEDLVTTADSDRPEDPEAADEEADLSDLLTQNRPVDVATPDVPQTMAPDVPQGAEIVAPQAEGLDRPDASDTTSRTVALAPPPPRDAPRIDSQSAPRPPQDAKPSEETVADSRPEESETPVEEAETPEAPEESTTEIPLDRVEESDESGALIAAGRPKPRPASITEAIETAERTEIAALAAQAAAESETPAAPAETPDATETGAGPAETSLPVGPPLTRGEKDGLRLAVERCWNPPAGVRDASDLVVIVDFELNIDGQLVGDVGLVEPSGSLDSVYRAAYEAARRAIKRCAPYEMPAEKFEQWRRIEVKFNPRNVVM